MTVLAGILEGFRHVLNLDIEPVKMVKTRLLSRLNDVNLARLMRIAIEGPQLLTLPGTCLIDNATLLNAMCDALLP